MKKKSRDILMSAPSTRQIFVATFLLLQVVNVISSQANNKSPLDNNELDRSGERIARALKLSQDEEAECPHCNNIEVSFCESTVFLINSL